MFFGPYVSVAEQRRKAEEIVKKMRAQGKTIFPVEAFAGQIAKSVWGKRWCENLQSYADFEYRLDRGKRYVRAGCVCNLEIEEGIVRALVSGTSLYKVKIKITPLDKDLWRSICERCAGRVVSLAEIMTGKLSEEVMDIVSAKKTGLFPVPNQIEFSCSCPDYAGLCKHVAATLYAIGRRLDSQPELLFLLRGVEPAELLPAAMANVEMQSGLVNSAEELSNLFGIDIDMGEDLAPVVPAAESKTSKPKNEIKPPFDVHSPTGLGILKLRELTGLSQKDFAEKINVCASTISKWENSNKLNLRYQYRDRLRKFQDKLIKKLNRKNKK